MKKQILYILSTIFILTSCISKNSVDKSSEEQFDKYLGVWHNTFRHYEYSADLKIDSMNNFIYEGGACASSFLSKGSWKLNGDTIVLNSFQPKECYYVLDFGIKYIVEPPIIGDTTIHELRTSIKGCEPDLYYITYILFNDERFIIKNDTLIHIAHTKTPSSDIIKEDFIKHTKDNETE